jgi:hypothetical protein
VIVCDEEEQANNSIKSGKSGKSNRSNQK